MIEAGQWHHVAVTLDAGATLGSGAITGYFDGVVFASGPASQLWPRNEIGMGDRYEGTRFDADSQVAGADSGGYGFVGKLDDIRVYNRVLTETEIAGQTSPEPPADPPENPTYEHPIAWWKLDGNAQDSSGYKHHGVTPHPRTRHPRTRRIKFPICEW